MFKRLLCAFLGIVLILSLAACSNDKDKNDTNGDNSDSTSVSESIEEFSSVWELKDVTPTLDKFTTEEIDVKGNKINAISTAFSKFNADDAVKGFKENPYFANMYNNVYWYKEETHNFSNKGEESNVALIYDKYYIVGSGEGVQMSITVEQPRYHYATPNNVYMSIEMPSIEKVKQDEIYKLVQSYAPDLAEFAVYSKDINKDGDLSPEAVHKYNMSECIFNDGCSYQVTREISYSKGSSARISFSMYSYGGEYEKFYENNLQDETEIYKESDYTISSLFADKSLVLNPNNYKDFAEKYAKELFTDYKYASISSWRCYDYEIPEGGRLAEHYISIDIRNSKGDTIGSFSFNTNTGFTADKMYFQHVNLYFYPRESTVVGEQKETLKLFATKFNNLFGKFEVGEIAIDQNNDKRYCADVSAVAAGRDYSGKIEVENDDYYSIYMTMEYADY